MFIRTMFIRSKTLSLSVVSFVILLIVFAFSSSSLGFKQADATSVNSTFTTHLNEVLTMSAPGSIEITNCNPSTSSLCTASASVSVVTNNITGYSLYMNATNGSSSSLTNTLTTPSSTIPTLSQSYSSSNFPTNYWGYTGGTDQSGETGGYNCATNYCPILAYESTESNYAPNHIIKQTDAPAATSTTDLTFAAKADTSKASGTYTTSVTFTAVANEVPAQPIHDGMNMQDIDADVCNATPLYSVSNTTYTVVDSRDQTNYTVAKLEDGNCWMLDNLALDLVASQNNITSSNTNASDTYLNYLKGTSTGTTSDQYPTAGVAYWTSDLSYSAPLIAISGSCNDSSRCVNTPSTGQWTSEVIVSVTYGNGSGKIGIYYNYCAASAGSYCWGDDTDETGSPSSDPKPDTLYDIDADICPAGWHVPTTSDSGGEYYYLYNTAYSTNATNFKNALSTPLSGEFYNGSADGQEWAGWFWSSTWYNTYRMRSLSVNASNVYPSDNYGRDYGFSVRCMVPGA